MNNRYHNKVIEPIGFIVAAAVFLASLILFYLDTDVFMGSLFAAIISSGLSWATYIMLRWVLLAYREK